MVTKDTRMIFPAMRSFKQILMPALTMLTTVSTLTTCTISQQYGSANAKTEKHVSLLAADGSGLIDHALYHYEYGSAANLTIRQLIEVGSQAVGPWPVGGLGWPVMELLSRAENGDASAVAEASRTCLATTAIAENSHSFCAYVLASIDPIGANDTFIRNFPQLNSRGQHEVLLYAYEFGIPEYAPLLADALDRISEWPEHDRFPFLVAVYSLAHYHPELHQSISRYYTRFKQEIADYAYQPSLDGFPYSDVVLLSVDDAPLLFASAVEFGDNMALLAERGMSAQERQLVDDFHAMLERTERNDLPVHDRSLNALVAELNDLFNEQVFALHSDFPAGDELITRIGGSQISALEILVQLCNRYDLDINSGSFPFGWQIGSPGPSSIITVKNSCFAYGSFLARLDTRGEVSGIPTRVSVRLYSGNRSVSFLRPQFLMTPLTAGRANFISAQRRVDIKTASIRILDIAKNSDLSSPFNLSGTIKFNVPASFHQLHQTVLPGMANFSLIHGPFKLQYVDQTEAIRIFLSGPTCCDRMSINLPTFNVGSVKMFNDSGESIEERFSPYTNSSNQRSSGFVYLSKQSRNFNQPASLVWTVAPTLKPYSFDVEFKDVRLMRQLSEESPADQ